MENGGGDFFDWIVRCHQWIRDGRLSLKQWRQYIRDLLLQICGFVEWLHSAMNVCHLDISLENMLIQNNRFKADGKGGVRLSRKMQIKICDFGLAEYFDPDTNPSFECTKFVGKTHYKSPKVYAKREPFDARKADIWSLGVSCFMMMAGAPPYKLPTAHDEHYPLVEQHDVMAILRRWGRAHYVEADGESLLNGMLNVDEAERLSALQLLRHPFFRRHQKHSVKMNRPKRRSLKMETYRDDRALRESANHNIFQRLVRTDDDGQLFRYRKRKLTST